MNEPRNWKWMVPATAVPVLFMLALTISELTNKNFPILLSFGCHFTILALMCIAGISAVANFRNYFQWEEVERFKMRQDALSTTPITLLSQNIRQMHPEAVRLLNRFGVRTSWQVKVGRGPEDVDWILLDTNVHLEFVEYFLDHSTDISVMPKRLLSEGAFHFDSVDRLVKDYQQYDEFQAWLLARMMITRPFGNQAAQWIPPWRPALVKEIMALSEDGHNLQTGETQTIPDLSKETSEQ